MIAIIALFLLKNAPFCPCFIGSVCGFAQLKLSSRPEKTTVLPVPVQITGTGRDRIRLYLGGAAQPT